MDQVNLYFDPSISWHFSLHDLPVGLRKVDQPFTFNVIIDINTYIFGS